MPEYQRGKVWTKGKKQKFIDTLLRGWHVPKFFFRVIDEEEQVFDCVDGQQRLNTVFEFYANELELSEVSFKEFGGLTYSSLPLKIQDKFDDYTFQVEEIELENKSDEGLENELFSRLQLGTPLNTAEKLNAVGGGLRDYIKELTKSDFFKKAINVKDTRFAHFVLCARFFYLEIYNVSYQIRQEQLEEMLKKNKDFSKNSTVAKKVKGILDILNECFKDHPKTLNNRANIVSCYYLISQFSNATNLKKDIKELKDFFENFFDKLQIETEKGPKGREKEFLDYLDAISRNTDSRDAINRRNFILLTQLSIAKPKLFQKINLRGSDNTEVIRYLAEEISTLISHVNKGYLKKNGEEKIKYTTDNANFEKILNKPLSTENDFGEMIDVLYKLVYEGSGNGKRLINTKANVVEDIKLLRLDLRHDIEHGEKGEIKKKYKKIADVYFYYTGKDSLSLLDTRDLLKMQTSLYSKVLEFLKKETE